MPICAAWRGLSVSLIEKPIWRVTDESIRWNAVCCGLLFVFLGRHLLRVGKKPHFEPAAIHLGWLLILGALVSGGWMQGLRGIAYIGLLAAVGKRLARHGFHAQRFPLFSFGVLAVFIALNEIVIKLDLGFVPASFLVSFAAIGLIALLWKAHRRMKEPLGNRMRCWRTEDNPCAMPARKNPYTGISYSLYFLYILPPISSSNLLIKSLSSRFQPSSHHSYRPPALRTLS
jgi:hypothetical protein